MFFVRGLWWLLGQMPKLWQNLPASTISDANACTAGQPVGMEMVLGSGPHLTCQHILIEQHREQVACNHANAIPTR